MSYLSKLKLSNRTRSATLTDPIPHRRQKMLTLIERQIKAFEANEQGKFHTYSATRVRTNSETGERRKVEVPVKVQHWWWKDQTDKYYLILKYGNRRLKLDSSNTTIEVGAKNKLIPILNSISAATNAGELDKAIEQALNKG